MSKLEFRKLDDELRSCVQKYSQEYEDILIPSLFHIGIDPTINIQRKIDNCYVKYKQMKQILLKK